MILLLSGASEKKLPANNFHTAFCKKDSTRYNSYYLRQGGTLNHFNPKIHFTKKLRRMKYKYVIAYTFNTSKYAAERDIISDGQFDRSAKLPGSIMTKEQIDTFLSTINDENTYGGAVYACFQPRMGVVFYDKDSTVVGEVSICFECNQLSSSFDIPAEDKFLKKHISVYGFSKTGIARLEALCKELNLERCGGK
jgi:hypothetical protein